MAGEGGAGVLLPLTLPDSLRCIPPGPPLPPPCCARSKDALELLLRRSRDEMAGRRSWDCGRPHEAEAGLPERGLPSHRGASPAEPRSGQARPGQGGEGRGMSAQPALILDA